MKICFNIILIKQIFFKRDCINCYYWHNNRLENTIILYIINLIQMKAILANKKIINRYYNAKQNTKIICHTTGYDNKQSICPRNKLLN